MKGIDTNVLVRFLVNDDPGQAGLAYNLFKQAESTHETLFVPLTVMLELIWVLESAYRIPRKDILESIHELMLLSILKFEHQPALQRFLRLARKNNLDLADLLIASSAREQGCTHVLTFDKKAAQSELFALLR